MFIEYFLELIVKDSIGNVVSLIEKFFSYDERVGLYLVYIDFIEDVYIFV